MLNNKPDISADLKEFLLVNADGTAASPTIESSPSHTPLPASPHEVATLREVLDDILERTPSPKETKSTSPTEIQLPLAVIQTNQAVIYSTPTRNIFDESNMNDTDLPQLQATNKKSFSTHVKEICSGFAKSFKKFFSSCFGCCKDTSEDIHNAYELSTRVQPFVQSSNFNAAEIPYHQIRNQTPEASTTCLRKRLA